jgi:FkbM family methyltransferase
MMKKTIKSLFRSAGFDVIRYLPALSATAQLQQIFLHQSFDVVVDVGANKGNYARSLRDIGYGDIIIAFEPQSSAYIELQKIANKDRKLVLPPRMALGDRDGEITLNISANSESSSVVSMLDSHLKAAPDSVCIGTEVVPVRRLDTILFDYLPPQSKSIFMKIDVQGFERQVLIGAEGILPLVEGIQLELSLTPLYEGERTISEMINHMHALGFAIHAILPAFTENRTGRAYQMDGIFIREDAVS